MPAYSSAAPPIAASTSSALIGAWASTFSAPDVSDTWQERHQTTFPGAGPALSGQDKFLSAPPACPTHSPYALLSIPSCHSSPGERATATPAADGGFWNTEATKWHERGERSHKGGPRLKVGAIGPLPALGANRRRRPSVLAPASPLRALARRGDSKGRRLAAKPSALGASAPRPALSQSQCPRAPTLVEALSRNVPAG